MYFNNPDFVTVIINWYYNKKAIFIVSDNNTKHILYYWFHSFKYK